jgi:2-methylcitrate dehydratase PrpD
VLTNDLGQRYGILDVWFKRYPTCAYCNSTLDVVLDLKRRYGISADEVERVTVRTFPTVKATVDNPLPENFTAAMLSMPYSVAVALLLGRVTPSEFEGEMWADPGLQSVMRKVHIEAAEEELLRAGLAHDRGTMVSIVCKDGKRYDGSAKAPRGDPMFPFTDEDVLEKYRRLASSVFDSATVEAIATLVRSLEEVDDITRLADLMRLP